MTVHAAGLDNVRARTLAIIVCAIVLPTALWLVGVPADWCRTLGAVDFGVAIGTLARWDRLPYQSIEETLLTQLAGGALALLVHIVFSRLSTSFY